MVRVVIPWDIKVVSYLSIDPKSNYGFLFLIPHIGLIIFSCNAICMVDAVLREIDILREMKYLGVLNIIFC